MPQAKRTRNANADLTRNSSESNLVRSYSTPWLVVLVVAVVGGGCCLLSCLPLLQQAAEAAQLAHSARLSGVSRQLEPFCSAKRPSLQVELALMVVHVKKDTSFNYKLYLLTANGSVFQTGQVVPRDDFRIHAFPAKLKQLGEFAQAQNSSAVDLRWLLRPSEEAASSGSRRRVSRRELKPQESIVRELLATTATTATSGALPAGGDPLPPEDASGDPLPGDEHFPATAPSQPQQQHRATKQQPQDLNAQVVFDRDDQLSTVASWKHRIGRSYLDSRQQLEAGSNPADSGSKANKRHQRRVSKQDSYTKDSNNDIKPQVLTPVGAFSSFRVNVSYVARKDFGEQVALVARLALDTSSFRVREAHWVHSSSNTAADGAQNDAGASKEEEAADCAFLEHPLLTQANVRITAITQIYEEWIARDFYTLVYVQRIVQSPSLVASDGLPAAANLQSDRESLETSGDESFTRVGSSRQQHRKLAQRLTNERLIFKGSTRVLLAADQIADTVHAAAFVTELRGLHYFFEFDGSGKFRLSAISWSQRPFKVFSARDYSLRATRMQLDSEELILCPPSPCYSQTPVDEIVRYGFVPTVGRSRRAAILLNGFGFDLPDTSAIPSNASTALTSPSNSLASNANSSGAALAAPEVGQYSNVAASGSFDVRLHLRDWIWPLRLQSGAHSQQTRFELDYRDARRNNFKPKPDSYGFALTGHDIDASFRVGNDLFVISSDQLTTISYASHNNSVTSKSAVGDEFVGLSSKLADPITGAFVDASSNQVFFFKSDRYVGYSLQTRRPLDEFVLTPSLTPHQINLPPTVATGPTASFFGFQVEVDAIYQDAASEEVLVISGMKFYALNMTNFRNGSFVDSRPLAQCINERLLSCTFDDDSSHPNPCSEETSKDDNEGNDGSGENEDEEEEDDDDDDKEHITVTTAAAPTGTEMQQPKPTSQSTMIPTTTTTSEASNETMSSQRLARLRLEPAQLETTTTIATIAPNTTKQGKHNEDDELTSSNVDKHGAKFLDEQQAKFRSIAAKSTLTNSVIGNNAVLNNLATKGDDDDDALLGRQQTLAANRPTKQLSIQAPETLIVYSLVSVFVLSAVLSVAILMMLTNWLRDKPCCERRDCLDLDYQKPKVRIVHAIRKPQTLDWPTKQPSNERFSTLNTSSIPDNDKIVVQSSNL